MKLQPITYRNPETGEQFIRFVRAEREPDEVPEVVVEVSTVEEYDDIAQRHEITQDARYWVE